MVTVVVVVVVRRQRDDARRCRLVWAASRGLRRPCRLRGSRVESVRAGARAQLVVLVGCTDAFLWRPNGSS